MPVEFDRGSPGKFDSRTLNRKTLNRWTGRMMTTRGKRDAKCRHVPGCVQGEASSLGVHSIV